jgi:hypothetical protein
VLNGLKKIDTYKMYELVDKLTVYSGDEYKNAFRVPVDGDTCTRLRADKWSACHPTGDPKVSHPVCTINMDEEELVDLYNAHMTCRNFRAMENSSKCFSMQDKGHKIAQRVQLTEANKCLALLKQKQDAQPKKLTKKQQQQRLEQEQRLEKQRLEQQHRLEHDMQQFAELQKEHDQKYTRKKTRTKTQDTQDIQDIQDMQDTQDTQDIQEQKDMQETQEQKDDLTVSQPLSAAGWRKKKERKKKKPFGNRLGFTFYFSVPFYSCRFFCIMSYKVVCHLIILYY